METAQLFKTLLLSDLDGEGEALRAALPWTILPLEAHTASPPNGEDLAVATDVALDDPQKVARLAEALGLYRKSQTTPLLVLLRDPTIFARATANALGATAILPADAAPADIAAKLRVWDNGAMRIASTMAHAAGVIGTPCPQDLADAMLAAATPPVQGRPLAVLVDTVHDALGKMLDSVRKRQPIAAETLQTGADALVEAIRSNGIRDWIDLVRRYDDMTYQHVLLVAGLTTAFAAQLGFTPAKQNLLAQAALVHDIGKAVIPHDILNKPGPLTASEMDLMRTHPARGYYMICHQPGIDSTVLDVVFNHHEFLDGTGYPNRLRKNQISEAARIVTICDIFGAMTERRPYKAPISPDASYAVLLEMGDRLDRGLVAAFQTVVENC